MATRTSLKDEELVSDPWAFVSPLAYGPVIISVAIHWEFRSLGRTLLMKQIDIIASSFLYREKQGSRPGVNLNLMLEYEYVTTHVRDLW